MKDVIKNRFKFDYENDSTSSYLVINMSDDENILGYQIEMLDNNPYQDILSLDIRQKNDTVKLYYNITSRLTLNQFLQRKKLRKDEFIDILRGVTKTLLESKEYFLYDNSFIIDEDYIYINPSTLEIGMIYLPVTLDTDVCENFKSFLVNLIISLAKIDEDSSGNYIQKILNYLKHDNFSISDFDKLLRDIKNEVNKMNSDRKTQLNQPKPRASNPHYDLTNPNNDMGNINHLKDGAKAIANKKTSKSMVSVQSHEEKETIIKRQYDRKPIFIAILAQIIIAVALAFSLDTIKSIAGDDISAYGGAALIVIALDTLLFRSLFKKENMKKIEVAKKRNRDLLSEQNQSLNMLKREIYNVKEPPSIENLEKGGVEGSELMNVVSSNLNETVILDEGKQETAYLERMSNGIMDRVPITKCNFIIGRLPDYVDHLIRNNAIGRTHAEVALKEDQYFIKDLNSKNGTFINKVRIDSNREYEINNGDKVKFADIEYKFVC